MRRTAILRAAIGLLIVTTLCVIIFAPGCNSEEELQSFQRQNQILDQRVAELEDQLDSLEKTNQSLVQLATELRNKLEQAEAKDQLSQAEAIAPITRTDAQASTAETVYTVVEGDSLWNIAEEQLGDGLYYKEILALNPRITKQDSLAVGMRLNLPSIEGFRN